MTATNRPVGMLCISSYFKGEAFLRSAKAEGCKVYFVTSKRLENEPWPWEAIDEVFYMEELSEGVWNLNHLAEGLAFIMRTRKIDKLVALDDFDVEKAALLREEFRISGMGQTTARYFRDKLAMRIQARDHGIPVPAFSGLFNDEEINQFVDTVPGPWLVKPRGQASATGIKKANTREELWAILDKLADKRHTYLVESFKPGDVYHVDSLCDSGKVVFSRSSGYLETPLDVAHTGKVFRTCMLEKGSAEDKALQALNADLMDAFGMQYSAVHSEFIRSREDGKYYFLETASRVGGAHIAEMVEIGTGINLWGEWARIEAANARGEKYKLPKVKNDYAGLIISLAREVSPNLDMFSESEVAWTLKKDFHIGMALRSDKRQRVMDLLHDFADRIYEHFHASAPVPDKPTS